MPLRQIDDLNLAAEVSRSAVAAEILEIQKAEAAILAALNA